MNPYLYGYRLIAALAALLFTTAAQAQSAQDFYKGKQIRMIVGFPAGNEYDIGARLLARYREYRTSVERSIAAQVAKRRQTMRSAAQPARRPRPQRR